MSVGKMCVNMKKYLSQMRGRGKINFPNSHCVRETRKFLSPLETCFRLFFIIAHDVFSSGNIFEFPHLIIFWNAALTLVSKIINFHTVYISKGSLLIKFLIFLNYSIDIFLLKGVISRM